MCRRAATDLHMYNKGPTSIMLESSSSSIQLISAHKSIYVRVETFNNDFFCRKRRKDKVIKSTVRETKLTERQTANQKLREQRQKELEAEKLYEEWVKRKVRFNIIVLTDCEDQLGALTLILDISSTITPLVVTT